MTTVSALMLFLGIIFAGCGNKAPETVTVPPNILSEEQFVKVLTDFSLAESAANMNIKNVPLYKSDTVYAFNPLKENNVRRSQYDSSLSFYIKNPAIYKRIYENVLANITEIQTRRMGIKKDPASK